MLIYNTDCKFELEQTSVGLKNAGQLEDCLVVERTSRPRCIAPAGSREGLSRWRNARATLGENLKSIAKCRSRFSDRVPTAKKKMVRAKSWLKRRLPAQALTKARKEGMAEYSKVRQDTGVIR